MSFYQLVGGAGAALLILVAPHFLLLSSGHLATSPSKRVSPHWPAEAANWVSRIGNS